MSVRYSLPILVKVLYWRVLQLTSLHYNGFNFTVVNTEIFYYMNANCHVKGGTFYVMIHS